MSLGQANPPGAAHSPTTKSVQPGSTPNFLAGLTLTGGQQAKIDQIRQETKSHLDAVAKDSKMAPEVKDAMVGGFQRIENTKIFEVLTPEQRRAVLRQMAARRAAATPHRSQFRQSPLAQRNPQPK